MFVLLQAEILQKRRKLGTYRKQPADFADFFLQEIDKNGEKIPNYITGELLNKPACF